MKAYCDVHQVLPDYNCLSCKQDFTTPVQPSRNPHFTMLLSHMQALHDRKSHDYAEDGNVYSNFEWAAEYVTKTNVGISPEVVFDVLIGIKMARLKELWSSRKTPNNESILDTMIDELIYRALKLSYYLKVNGIDKL